MFVAKREDGILITLHDCNDTSLQEKIRRYKYNCPACGSEVKLKSGNIRRMHFAHLDTECRASSEAETSYHLEGKSKLHEALKINGSPELEYYIPKTSQRADVFLRTEQDFAFEFQCSSIQPSVIEQRSSSYQSESIIPVWLIGKEKLGNIQSYMKLSAFQWSFLQNHKEGASPYILSFCPRYSVFHYLYPLFGSNSLDSYIFSKTSKEWQLQPSFIKKQPPSYWKTKWLHSKKRWRYTHCLYPANQMLRNYCYSKVQIPLSLCPAVIGIPVKSSFWFQTPVQQWQAWLYFDSIYHTPIHYIIHIPSLMTRFNQRIQQAHVKVKQLPLVRFGYYTDAVMEYLEQLCITGILEKESDLVFRKAVNEKKYSTLEEATAHDKDILDRIELEL
ncbi:competence CoiA-like predicted nuclease [Bacillus tianshenii]|uniref:Competence CoiA-like predicted nuclease n=1 Tax=Sutcliffiella tianshenii TaxID=1463404 RepID=A0ABS2P105_9BACI|nr:competence protein CoiA family protein [Bacillus tianshenii]MBM7620617.1 competence CoiA-like predicted nuclease [Bacillus tianshenii]